MTFGLLGSRVNRPPRLWRIKPYLGRPVHPGSEEPERHRAAQAPLQHALGGLRHAEWLALADLWPTRRGSTGHGGNASAGEKFRPRGEKAGGGRQGSL